MTKGGSGKMYQMIPTSRRGAMFGSQVPNTSVGYRTYLCQLHQKELILQFQVLSLTTLNQIGGLWSSRWHFLDVASFQCLGFSIEVISAIKVA